MKNISRKFLDEITHTFEKELNQSLSINVIKDTIIYRNYVIKLDKNKTWCLCTQDNKRPIDIFFMKVSALIAAKAIIEGDIDSFNRIKFIDRLYTTSKNDIVFYKNILRNTKSPTKQCIIETKMDLSLARIEHYKKEIQGSFIESFIVK